MKRGEIWLASLDPTEGQEQRGTRPVLIVSPTAFHNRLIPIICPIATAGVGQRLDGLTVMLVGAGTLTTGIVICNQVRVLDFKKRAIRRIETVPTYILEEVLACLQDIFEA
jgi:mRNA interferase ChpB